MSYEFYAILYDCTTYYVYISIPQQMLYVILAGFCSYEAGVISRLAVLMLHLDIFIEETIAFGVAHSQYIVRYEIQLLPC